MTKFLLLVQLMCVNKLFPQRVGDVLLEENISHSNVFGSSLKKIRLFLGEPLPLGECREYKGWIPKQCLQEFIDDGITILEKKKVQ